MTLLNIRFIRWRTAIFILFSLNSTALIAKDAAGDPINDGTLVLSKTDGSASCTIPFKTGIYDFSNNGGGFGCANDDKSELDLKGVPSATTVYLYDTPDCNDKKDQNYWIEFKTIKQPTNVTQLKFSKFFDKGNEEVVVPGVMRVDAYHRNDDSIDGKLSCVKIIRSTMP